MTRPMRVNTASTVKATPNGLPRGSLAATEASPRRAMDSAS